MKIPSLTQSFFLALIVSFIMLTSWEFYWRAQGFPAAPEDNKGLWAMTRAKVEKADSNQVVILGSSRALFNFQLDEWEAVTGIRPIMLAAAGKTPSPFLDDIVNHTDFRGTLVIGVAPGLFFSPTDESGGAFRRSKNFVDYYHNRTYAQRVSDFLYVPVNQSFAFVMGAESPYFNNLNLKSLINEIPFSPRVKAKHPFPFFGYVDKDRNMQMWERMEWDTTYALGVKHIWVEPGEKFTEPSKKLDDLPCALDFYATQFQRFQDRGGKIILVQNPVQGELLKRQNIEKPRAWFWDLLIQATGVPGYYFKDYPFMNKYILPEWSHMSAPQAREYTRELVSLMVNEGKLGIGR